MVSFLLEMTKPSDRMWIVGQPPAIALRDAAHLLVRVVLLTACTICA